MKPDNAAIPEEYRAWLESLDEEHERAAHLQFVEDSRYLGSITDDMRSKHGDCYVAVYKGEVLVGGTQEEVLAAMDDRGIPRAHAATAFITREPLMIII